MMGTSPGALSSHDGGQVPGSSRGADQGHGHGLVVGTGGWAPGANRPTRAVQVVRAVCGWAACRLIQAGAGTYRVHLTIF